MKYRGFGLLGNGGQSILEIMGQDGVFPAIYPKGAKMALGWPTSQKGIFQHARAARLAKKISGLTGSKVGWIRVAWNWGGGASFFEIMAQRGGVPYDTHEWCQNGTWVAN